MEGEPPAPNRTSVTARPPAGLWALAAAFGLGSVGLLGYRLLEPEPPRNLADPIPRSAPAPIAYEAAAPSAARSAAEKHNAAKQKECEARRHDCGIACRQYPAGTPSHGECIGFCEQSLKTCESWTHR